MFTWLSWEVHGDGELSSLPLLLLVKGLEDVKCCGQP